MKRGFLLFFTALIFQVAGAQDWKWLNPCPSGFMLYSVHFADTSTGYSVGDRGAIVKITDGGNTLKGQNSGTSVLLTSVFFTDPDHGCVSGEQGLILNTADGGTTWTTRESGTGNTLHAVCFFPQKGTKTGFAVGYDGTILKTTDGGTSWTKQISGTPRTLYSVCFPRQDTGYAVGDWGTILKTTNGGTTWTQQNSGIERELTSVCFLDANTGYALGHHEFYKSVLDTIKADTSYILKTTDGGNTWALQAKLQPCNYFFLSISFTSPDTGYIVGTNGKIWKTTDGGTIWNERDPANTKQFNSVFFIPGAGSKLVMWPASPAPCSKPPMGELHGPGW